MASERSKRRDLLALSFITKSISKKLLIRKDNGDAKFWVATGAHGLLVANEWPGCRVQRLSGTLELEERELATIEIRNRGSRGSQDKKPQMKM